MISVIAISLFFLSGLADDDTESIQLHSSCNQITKDGLYYIKPTETGNIIPVICSNGYTMIDLSLDINLNSYTNYLTSYSFGRDSTEYILPNLDDQSTFSEWWILSNENTNFRVAKDCISCDTSDEFGDDVVYYSDSSLFCFAVYPQDACDIENDIKYNEYACNQCDVGSITKCYALQMKSDSPIDYDHDQCVTHGLCYRPVLSLIRDSCTCYQPDASVIYNDITIDELPPVTISTDLQSLMNRNNIYVDDLIIFQDDVDGDNSEDDQEVINNCLSNKVYLTNDDFESGTYRILECGEYILSEDIILNFNPASSDDILDIDFSPNSIDNDELYWFPTRNDDESGKYRGLYSYIGSYTLGFFAGITIESDNVIINLNGFSISQEYIFYFQQRYFTLIEIAAKYFLPNQGPGNWDISDEYYPINVEIHGPGTLGLSSHHAIHGMRNQNVYIHDIDIQQFDVAGLQCNGCNDIVIDSVSVGPQNTDIPVLGRYAHARALLPRLKQLNEDYGDNDITFYQRDTVSVSYIVQRLINQMDMMYHHFINDVQYEDDDAEWIAAQTLFLNPTGWMDGGSSYGIVLNGDGAAVVGMGSRIQETSNISIFNTEIYGIYNNVIEKLKISINKVGATRLILFDTIDWMSVIDQVDDIRTAQYVGDAYSDCIFAIYQNVNSWLYLNSLYITTNESEFVFNGNDEKGNILRGIFQGGSPSEHTCTGCNTDIQLHSSKGAIGLRFDGTQGINLDNIYIHDIVNWADLGADWCGLQPGPSVSNEDHDIQYGYTGTRAHGLIFDYTTGTVSNINIQSVESYNGEANGITVYKECDIIFNENIFIDSINAGTQLSEDAVKTLTLPNLIPRACGIDILNNTNCTFNSTEKNIIINNVYGYDNCINSEIEGINLYHHITKIDNSNSVSSSFDWISITMISLIIIGLCIVFCVILQTDTCKKIINRNSINTTYYTPSEFSPLLNTL